MSSAAAAEPTGKVGAAPYRRIAVEPFAAACGALISNVALWLLDDATLTEIRRALHDHLVIFFRDQELTVEEHKALGRRFGTLNVHPQYVPIEGHPEILPVVKEPADQDNIGDLWHTDVTFLERPSMGAILYGIEVPEVGGDTLFSNQYLAYETLSTGMKAMLANLRAWHSDRILSAGLEARNATRSTNTKDHWYWTVVAACGDPHRVRN